MNREALLKQLGVGGLLIGLSSGCTTSWLWDSTDPNEKLWISAEEITEEELQKKGIEYEVYDVEPYKGFLVDRSFLRKFHEFHLRLFGTPVTLVVDGVGYLTVGLAGVLYNNPDVVAHLLDTTLN